MKTIAIVGFGFCGKMTFVNLVKSFGKKYKILIFDKSFTDFASAAFAPFSSHYILNVAVGKMSAFSSEPQSFSNFLQKNYPQIFAKIGESGFAPRKIYGEYLKQILDEAMILAEKEGVEFQLINQEVASIAQNNSSEQFVLSTKNGEQFYANEIALATSFTQTKFPWNLSSNNLVKNLWDQNSLAFHQRNFVDEKICIIGSGLTTVDVIVGLKNKNFTGKILVISRRGNFPTSHFSDVGHIAEFITAADAKKGVLFLCLKIRNFLRANPQFDLRHVIYSLREITRDLWHNFDAKNKKLFLRFFPYWNIFRHRAPQKSIAIIEEMIASGQLELRNGGVLDLIEQSDKIIVKTKKGDFAADYVVNCLGFEFNAKKYSLLDQMISSGLLKADFLMVQSNNKKVHLLGGLNIGKDLECTAVPDLRVTVEKLISVL